jgi:hypothetical protein
MNFLEVRRQTFFNAIAMSALGHKRTFAVQNVISALYPPKDGVIGLAIFVDS